MNDTKKTRGRKVAFLILTIFAIAAVLFALKGDDCWPDPEPEPIPVGAPATSGPDEVASAPAPAPAGDPAAKAPATMAAPLEPAQEPAKVPPVQVDDQGAGGQKSGG